jgi:hypothetical protein
MPETTPMQMRMNDLYNEIRALLGKTQPDRAEMMRREIVIALVRIKVAVQKRSGDKASRNPNYRQGDLAEDLDMDWGRMQEVIEMYVDDFERLLQLSPCICSPMRAGGRIREHSAGSAGMRSVKS